MVLLNAYATILSVNQICILLLGGDRDALLSDLSSALSNLIARVICTTIASLLVGVDAAVFASRLDSCFEFNLLDTSLVGIFSRLDIFRTVISQYDSSTTVDLILLVK